MDSKCNIIVVNGIVFFTNGVVRDNKIRTKKIAYLIKEEIKLDSRINN